MADSNAGGGSDGSDAGSSGANDSETNGSETNDSKASGSEANGSEANGSEANGSEANDSEANGSEANESDSVRTLVVDCTPGYGSTTYTVAVSGGLEQVDGNLDGHWVTCDAEATSCGSAARGCVVGCAHGYRFTGDVTSLTVAAPTQCTVYVDGEEVEPELFDADAAAPLEVAVSTEKKTLDPGESTTVSAIVTNADGERQSDATVDFRLLDSPRGRGTLDPASATTDDDGVATITYTAPSVESVDRIRARVDGATATVGVATGAGPVRSTTDRDDSASPERPGGPGAVRERPNSLQLR